MKRRMFVLAMSLFAPLAFADGIAELVARPVFHGEGILNRVDPGLGVINLTHGPVAFAGWQTMTRDLTLKPKTLAKDLVPGMRVRFRLQAEDGLHYRVVAIEPLTSR